jgi:hypothetical protein
MGEFAAARKYPTCGRAVNHFGRLKKGSFLLSELLFCLITKLTASTA